jgi:hypothetical protein
MNSFIPAGDLQRVDLLNDKVKNLASKLEVRILPIQTFIFKKIKNYNFQNVEHLSWLGLFKDTKFINLNNSISINNNKKVGKFEKLKLIKEKFKNFS